MRLCSGGDAGRVWVRVQLVAEEVGGRIEARKVLKLWLEACWRAVTGGRRTSRLLQNGHCGQQLGASNAAVRWQHDDCFFL